MKRVDRVAPITIQAKVGALARCTDWGMCKGFLTMPDNALRSIPRRMRRLQASSDRMLSATYGLSQECVKKFWK